MIQFGEKIYFYLLAIIPVIVLVFFFLQIWKSRTQKAFASPRLLKKIAPDKSRNKSGLKLIFFVLGLVFLIVGLVNPKIGTKLETVKREGVDIVFAVDVSKSRFNNKKFIELKDLSQFQIKPSVWYPKS